MVDDVSSGEVTLFLEGEGLYVDGDVQAVDAVLDELLQPAELEAHRRAATRVADAAAAGASVAATAATAREYLRLTPESLERVRQLGAQTDGTGALRGYVRGSGGRFAGDLTFDTVTFGAEQALAFQTAAVSLALRSAIANVQAAVERVEDKVADLQRRIGARELGEVVGSYRSLERVVAATTARGHLLEADWDALAGAGLDLTRALETMRAYVTKSMDALNADARLPKRQAAVKKIANPDGVAGTLRLILVAEQALHLWEYLRLERVRQTDPEHVASALEEARQSLRTQREQDDELVRRSMKRLKRVREIGPLEVHWVLAIPEMQRASDRVIGVFERFAEGARAPLPTLNRVVRRPQLSETRGEVKRNAIGAKDDVVHVTRAAGRATASGAKKASGATAKGAKKASRRVRRAWER